MKKLLLPALLIFAASCSNPEDRATGNPDSSRFNSDDKKVLNAGNGPLGNGGNKSDAKMPDTSVSHAASGKNADTSTKVANRSYGKERDALEHK